MAISYNLLWKKLIDLGLSKTDMMRRAKISTNVLARLSKGEPVSMDSMEKICKVLNCNIGDEMCIRDSCRPIRNCSPKRMPWCRRGLLRCLVKTISTTADGQWI